MNRLDTYLGRAIPSVCLVLLLLVWPGCSSPPDQINLVLTASDSLLVDVLIDLHKVDAEIFTKAKSQTEAGEQIVPTFSDFRQRDSVLLAHGLSEEAFNELIELHLDDPVRFLLTYNQVLDRSAANQ